mmetsp:Transcript_3915/g.5289  ORF Transcript_3915/g.5289 Transcript_3915/m.5289 type:complete len:91 (-) Transcript_3915:239-511(-)
MCSIYEKRPKLGFTTSRQHQISKCLLQNEGEVEKIQYSGSKTPRRRLPLAETALMLLGVFTNLASSFTRRFQSTFEIFIYCFGEETEASR